MLNRFWQHSTGFVGYFGTKVLYKTLSTIDLEYKSPFKYDFVLSINLVLFSYMFWEYFKNIIIFVQIVRNSFFSSSQTTHPGLFVFLASSKAADRIRLVTELASPRMLKDKHSLRLLVRKQVGGKFDSTSVEVVVEWMIIKTGFMEKIDNFLQVETNLRRHECGSSLEAAERYDLFAFPPAPNSNNLTFATCLIEAAIQQCACVPLSVVIWTLQGDLNM